jgi:hypothetical protein
VHGAELGTAKEDVIERGYELDIHAPTPEISARDETLRPPEIGYPSRSRPEGAL